MKNVRFSRKILIKLLSISLMVLSFAVSTYLFHQFLAIDELTLQEKYLEKKEYYEHLAETARSPFKEGHGINILECTSNKNIEYDIYNDGQNVIFRYIIKLDNCSYYTTLTLSKDYNILHEESDELEDYETFKAAFKIDEQFLFAMFGFIFMGIFVMTIFCPIFALIQWLSKRKKETLAGGNNS